MPADAESGLKPPVYVDTDAALRKLVTSLRNQPWIAVDTESNPLFAYHEKLCLIQISTRTRDYIIDPLADIDLRQFVPIMALALFRARAWQCGRTVRAGSRPWLNALNTRQAHAAAHRGCAPGDVFELERTFAPEDVR